MYYSTITRSISQMDLYFLHKCTTCKGCEISVYTPCVVYLISNRWLFGRVGVVSWGFFLLERLHPTSYWSSTHTYHSVRLCIRLTLEIISRRGLALPKSAHHGADQWSELQETGAMVQIQRCNLEHEGDVRWGQGQILKIQVNPYRVEITPEILM